MMFQFSGLQDLFKPDQVEQLESESGMPAANAASLPKDSDVAMALAAYWQVLAADANVRLKDAIINNIPSVQICLFRLICFSPQSSILSLFLRRLFFLLI